MRLSALALLLSSRHITALNVPRVPAHGYGSSVSFHGARSPRNDVILRTSVDDFVSTNAIDEDDFDDFLNELTEEPTSPAVSEQSAKNETSSKGDSSHFIQREAAVGIGGSTGFTYDVNALKRNLVQESVRGCKQELLTLLGDGREYSSIKNTKAQRPISVPQNRRERDDLIEERLASLVQV